MILMGLDYGSKTVGVAFSDALYLTAQPAETITRDSENKLRRTCARLEQLAKERGAGRIVLGRPLNMDGTAGERVEKCEAFKVMLERRTGLPVDWQDERLTTVAADEILEETGVRKQDRKKVIDQVAACLILKEYMDAHPEYGKENHDGTEREPDTAEGKPDTAEGKPDSAAGEDRGDG